MYEILEGREQLINGDAFPDWVDLSAFAITTGADKQVEWHHHDHEEAWLWWRGRATAWVDGLELSLLPGSLLIVPAHRAHAFAVRGESSNTLIVPRIKAGQHWGHRHQYKLGETLCPAHSARFVQPDENHQTEPYAFAEHWFARHMYGAILGDGQPVLAGELSSWAALLVREGTIRGEVDGEQVELRAGQCCCLSAAARPVLRACGGCDCAIVVGQPC